MTEFERRVYETVRLVPRGRVTTYRAIARKLLRGSPRAVGQALKRNPDSPAVPCHRVIASDLSPGGFQGHRGGAALLRKLSLLRREGVRFRNGKLSDPTRVFLFE